MTSASVWGGLSNAKAPLILPHAYHTGLHYHFAKQPLKQPGLSLVVRTSWMELLHSNSRLLSLFLFPSLLSLVAFF